MVTFGLAGFLLLVSFSGPTTSDESLLAEFGEAHPEADIWPQLLDCSDQDDDCGLIAGGPFAQGKWRITDLACAEELQTNGGGQVEDECVEHLNWYQKGVFHPKYIFRWVRHGHGLNDRIDSPVFLGDVGAFLGRTKGHSLYLVQRDMFGMEYNLVEAEAGKNEIIKKLREYPLSCADAGPDSWERFGFRHHDRPFRVWLGNYCEIRDLQGFRNLARRVLKNKPTRIWEYIGELPDSVREDGDDSG